MALPGFLAKVFSGGAKTVIDSVGGILDNVITNKEELAAAKLEAEKEIHRHFESLENNALEVYKAEVSDRDSARKREVGIAQAGKFDYMLTLTGATGLGIFIYLVYVLVNKTVPPENKELFIHLLGIIEGIILSIFAYYFGSSKSSRHKDKTISEIAKK